MPKRATMNPVLQISTKTAGMARTSELVPDSAEVMRSSFPGRPPEPASPGRRWRPLEGEAALRGRIGDELFNPLADFRQRLLQVIDHGPHGEDGGDPDQPGAPDGGVDHAEQETV